ncbi:MAG: glycosyltransferase family 39 protein [Chloroflexi bacterium]|nr:glycosyltransferase family 39 protein [Chloroflexota bacterium]
MKSRGRFLWVLIFAGLVFYLALTFWLAFIGLTYPYQLDYGEGIVLWFARQIAHGQPIYKPLDSFPYASANYPPLAMILSAALFPIFGDGYTGGRWLNFASALVVAALIFRIVRAETRDLRAAALAAIFFLGAPYIYHWIPLFRVDLIGLAFTFVGIYFVWRWERQSSVTSHQLPVRRNFLLSTAYFLLFTFAFLFSLYTKQTLIAAPLAAFLAIFLRDKRAAILFALALGALGGAIYFALDAATNGAFTFGVLTSNATVFLTDQLFALLKNFALTFGVLILLAVWEFLTRVRVKKFGVVEAYAITSFLGLILAGRVGAWENYFFEAIAIVCVLAGRAVVSLQSLVASQLTKDDGLGTKKNRLFAIRNSQFTISNFQLLTSNFQIILPVLLLFQLLLFWHDPRIAAQLVAEDFPANKQLDALLAQTQNPIISEDMGALATSGKQVAYYTFQYSSLARAGAWDQHWELDGLRRNIFPLVILERGTREDVEHYRRFTREFLSALDRYYAQTQTIGKFEIYSPAPPLHLQAANFGDEIAMVGWRTEPETLNSATLQLSIVWQAQRVMTRRYTAFVHLENARGEKIAQADHEPRGGVYPTTRWGAGEMVREVYTLIMPSDLPRGKYVLRAGWYDSESGERLSVAGSVDDAVTISEFER